MNLSVNMRSKKTADELKLLKEIFRDRKEKVNTRKVYEAEIEQQNKKIIKELSERLKPIAEKTRSQIYFTINDGNCTVSLEVTHTDKKSNKHVTLMQRSIPAIHGYVSTEISLRSLLRTVERNVRQMRMLMPKSEKITMGPKNDCKAVVKIQTRTRYF